MFGNNLLNTGYIQREDLQELELESLQSRRCYRKLAMFYKIYKNKSPFYLFNLIPEKTSSYGTRNVDCVPLIKIKYNFFKNTFFPSVIIEWNKLDVTIRNADSFGIFKSNILKFITVDSHQEVFLTVTTTKELD